MEYKLLKTLPADSNVEIQLADNIKDATLKISCNKDFSLGFTQYIVCKCFIIEFDLLMVDTTGELDVYNYTGKKIKLCDDPRVITEENVEEIFNESETFSTMHFLTFLENTNYSRGKYYLNNGKG